MEIKFFETETMELLLFIMIRLIIIIFTGRITRNNYYT